MSIEILGVPHDYLGQANESVPRAAELPPFMYVQDRLDAMEKVKGMIESRRRRHKSNPILGEKIQFMIVLLREGISYGEIGEKLYDH